MTDIEQIEEKALVQAMALLEDPSNLSDAEIQSASGDERVLHAYNELLDCRQAVQQRHGAGRFDANAAWADFNAKREPLSQRTVTSAATAPSSATAPSAATRKFYVFIGAVSGIAATLLLIFGYAMYRHYNPSLPEGLMVYQSDDSPQEVQLTADGDDVALETADKFVPIDGVKPRMTGKTLHALDYRGVTIPQEDNHRLTTPRGKDFQLILSDGTKVWLNADSKIDYPAKFSGGARVVQLQGEAYFEVEKDSEHPFIIKTKNFETKVLGTKLNVRSYSDEDSRVTLIEGSVDVKNTKSGSTVRLVPGEEARFMADGSIETSCTDVDSYVYWKEGFFYFDNVSLVDIMQTLGRWYNLNVIFANTKAMKYRLHFLCDRNGGVEHAVELLNRMKKGNVIYDGKSIIVE